jgi:hypothetical protein
MSFSSSTAQQANPADASKNENLSAPLSSLALEGSTSTDVDLQFRQRTFDVVWVEKKALMYREGISKVSVQVSRIILLIDMESNNFI